MAREDIQFGSEALSDGPKVRKSFLAGRRGLLGKRGLGSSEKNPVAGEESSHASCWPPLLFHTKPPRPRPIHPHPSSTDHHIPSTSPVIPVCSCGVFRPISSGGSLTPQHLGLRISTRKKTHAKHCKSTVWRAERPLDVP